jgi:hypothetical protein
MASSFAFQTHDRPGVRTSESGVFQTFLRIWKGLSDEDSKRTPAKASSTVFLPGKPPHPRPARATTSPPALLQRRKSLFRREGRDAVRVENNSSQFNRLAWRRAHVADTFPRPACLRCGEPVVWLGEALRIECAEGRAVVAHVCRVCSKSGAMAAIRADAEHHERASGAQMRRAA